VTGTAAYEQLSRPLLAVHGLPLMRIHPCMMQTKQFVMAMPL
jgi:hypothetical protein